MQNYGFIQLNRAVFKDDFFNHKPASELCVWMWLLGEAVYESKSIKTKRGMIEMHEGDVYIKDSFAMSEFGWNRGRWRSFKSRLCDAGYIHINQKNESHLTILKHWGDDSREHARTKSQPKETLIDQQVTGTYNQITTRTPDFQPKHDQNTTKSQPKEILIDQQLTTTYNQITTKTQPNHNHSYCNKEKKKEENKEKPEKETATSGEELKKIGCVLDNLKIIKQENPSNKVSKYVDRFAAVDEFQTLLAEYPNSTNPKLEQKQYITIREEGHTYDEIMEGFRKQKRERDSKAAASKWVPNWPELRNYLKDYRFLDATEGEKEWQKVQQKQERSDNYQPTFASKHTAWQKAAQQIFNTNKAFYQAWFEELDIVELTDDYVVFCAPNPLIPAVVMEGSGGNNRVKDLFGNIIDNFLQNRVVYFNTGMQKTGG